MRRRTLTFETLSDLIGRIYDAALDHEAMTGAFQELCNLLDAPYLGAGLVPSEDSPDAELDGPLADFEWTVGFSPVTMAEVYEGYLTGDTNPFLRRYRSQPLNKPFQTYDVLERPEFLRHPIYNRIYRPREIEPGLGVTISRDTNTTTVLSIFRTRSQEFFSSSETEFIQLLTPHIARALALRRRMSTVKQVLDTTTGVFDRLPQGVILLDAQQRIVSMNQIAQRLLDASNELHVSRGVLGASSVANDRRLQNLIGWAVDPANRNDHPAHHGLSIYPADGDNFVSMIVLPLRAGNMFVGSRQPRVAIFLAKEGRPVKFPADLLEDLYGLTSAEAKIVPLLMNGLSISEAAKKLDVSRNTVATQVRYVFEKTGCHKRSDLTRYILTGPAGLCLNEQN